MMKFYFTTDFDMNECTEDYLTQNGGGGDFMVGVAIMLVLIVGIILFGYCCCGWKLPECITESCCFKMCCDFGKKEEQQDRSAKYQENQQQ